MKRFLQNIVKLKKISTIKDFRFGTFPSISGSGSGYTFYRPPAIVFKAFQRGPTKYFFKKENIISCRSNKNSFSDQFVSSIPVIFSSKFRIAKIYGLPLHQMHTELGLLKRPVLPATNTAGALQQFQTEIASLAFSRIHWARNFVCFFPLQIVVSSPGLYITGQDWISFFVLIFLHFFIDTAQDTCKHIKLTKVWQYSVGCFSRRC